MSETSMRDVERHGALVRCIARRLAMAELDVVRIVDRILLRLEKGRDEYGPLNIAKSARNWREERAQEFEDVLVYTVIEELRRLDAQRARIEHEASFHMGTAPGDTPVALTVANLERAHEELTGRPPEPLATWTCRACGCVHPWDHEGMWCGTCGDMVACVGCERKPHEHDSGSVIAERIRETFSPDANGIPRTFDLTVITAPTIENPRELRLAPLFDTSDVEPSE